MFRVQMRFYEELNDFLAKDRRRRDFAVTFAAPRSVKDLIEAQGVPHTEVDLILANGEPVSFAYAVADGDRISVYPCFESFDVQSASRLGRPPLRQVRLVADVHLGRLVRWLRLLGLDCHYDPALDDAALAACSEREQRILLTRDRGLLKRRKVSHGICIRSDQAEEQVREVLDRLQAEGQLAPFSRCLACNGSLADVPAAAVAQALPPRVLATHREFKRCTLCGQVFWAGSHAARLERLVARFCPPHPLAPPPPAEHGREP